jgi:diguanylate cyclase (GGDEF)-like protein
MIDQNSPNTLIRSALFRGVSTTLVGNIAAGAPSRLLGAGERLLTAGAQNNHLYVVLSGSLSVRVPGTDASHVRVHAGECVGEISILDGRPASADVFAEESTVVLCLEREQVWALIDASADLARNLLRMLAGRVRYDDLALGESSRLQRYFERIATVDALTGLRNRRWLDDAFERQLDRAARAKEAVSLLMLDLDHFKSINDEHGHLIGDAVLGRVAHALSVALRPQDLVARYGGEEFAVLLPGLGMAEALAVAERLRQAVEHMPAESGASPLPPVTVSIGVTTRQGNETLAELLARADAAVYRAKVSGRNCVRE